VFEWPSGTLIIPELHASFAAVGAAVMAADTAAEKGKPEKGYSLDGLTVEEQQFPHSQPLSMENVVLLRDRMPVIPAADIIEIRDAFLGIDIGSVSTNLVVIDEEMNVLKEIYLRTEARPIEAVSKGLKEIEADLGEKILICGVGTTGSGRELIGELVGADTVHDEITAHKTGAAFIGRTILDMQPDTIFEIGGQDSKFISLEQGVVVDFAMNEACAAGTGSFLEERAKELGIQIKDEFSRTALSSRTPIRLGERCTVFMEQDVNAYIQHGAPLNDIVAGLAYSIATNYINRVVRGRKIGKVIFFQGGTAYNDSVAAAFSSILDTRIIVPPFNGVMGALGVALLAREKMLGSKRSTFRGFDLEKVDYKMREFTCKGCTNFCQMQEFTVENERTYWGDKCSERYRKAVKVEREPVIDNLIEFRRKQLLAGYDPESGDGPVVGIPWSMSTYEWAPFWFRIFRELKLKVLLSDQTTSSLVNQGLESVVSEPCFPIQAAHGHLRWLIDRNVDYILIPNYIAAPGNDPAVVDFYCPWNMTLPYVAQAAPFISHYHDRIICPSLWFNHGDEEIVSSIHESLKKVGLQRKLAAVREAVMKGFAAQQAFGDAIQEEGGRALATLTSHHEHGIILLGRPYNIYDRGINLDVAHKLRTYYGTNVIPLDFLNLEQYAEAQRAVHSNMFWGYGKKILAAAAFVRNKPKLHIIYITNFKCGPDSYIKHFIGEASGRPYLTLQFDGHNNDAGMLTRCEAYLDSKGVLRRWGTTQEEMAAGPSSR
jgi:predicted CoA-substrate-specific enzyme activase